jgi:hypothetical protein
MKKYNKYDGREDNFQQAIALYLDSLGLLWMHPPNEIRAKPQYLKKRKAMGVKSGVPDIIVFTPNKKYIGLAIELKVGYNKPTDNQLKWLDDLKKIGYYTLVSYSLEEVIDIVEAYIKNEGLPK